jgi:ribonuclease HII
MPARVGRYPVWIGMKSTSLQPGLGGIDEAGRGPLAGPVVAAAVVLSPGQHIAGVRDSKQLTAARREQLSIEVKCQALAWSIGIADVEEIDTLNILHATMLAMRRAVEGLGLLPEIIHVDGNRTPDLPGYAGNTRAIVGGDRTCGAISAASILAKVHRDSVMVRLDDEFPQYGFARHKGYPTKLHRSALMEFGPCSVHRRSFRPVLMAMNAHGASL